MLRIAVNAQINRPVQEVWDFFIDLTNSPHWTASGSELRQTSSGPPGLGMTVESVRLMFGREIKSQKIVVTQYEPGQRISLTTAVPLLGRGTMRFTFASVDGGTRLSREGEFGLGRAEGLLAPILTRMLRKGWRTEMANLKRLIEARR
jgi:uncharacterized protein YndB with AHSA1/START domain